MAKRAPIAASRTARSPSRSTDTNGPTARGSRNVPSIMADSSRIAQSSAVRAPIFSATASAIPDLDPTDAEKVPQLRSRIVQTLNIPQRVRLGPSLAAALLDDLFEHPAEVFLFCPRHVGLRNPTGPA